MSRVFSPGRSPLGAAQLTCSPLLMGSSPSGSLALGRGAVYTSEPEVRVAENKRELGRLWKGEAGRAGAGAGPQGLGEHPEQTEVGGRLPLSRLLLLLPPVDICVLCSRQVVLLLLWLLLSPRGVEVCPGGHHQPRLL